MNYRFLNEAQIRQIHQTKLLELEAEHARLELELRLAEVAGIDNDLVDAARGQRDVLVAQMAALTAWIADTVERPAVPTRAANGSEP